MNKTTAIGLALLSAALFGASAPAAKVLLGAVSPWLLAGLLYLGSGLTLSATLAVRRIAGVRSAEAPLRWPDAPWLAGAVALGGAVGPVLLMLGLARTPASTASLLLNLEGLATLGIAWVAFHEHVDRRLMLGAAAILAGAALTSWNGASVGAAGIGALCIAGACVCWGLDNNLTRKISGADPLQIAAIKGLVAGAANVAIGLAQGAAAPPLTTIAWSGLVGALGYGVSLISFIVALRHLGAARTGAYFSTAPFVGAALSAALLHEPMTLWLALAAALMGVGVWLHLTEDHAHRHTHEALEHAHRHRHDAHHQHAHAAGDPPGEPHSHWHRHTPQTHTHPHYPDLHHRHGHGRPEHTAS